MVEAPPAAGTVGRVAAAAPPAGIPAATGDRITPIRDVGYRSEPIVPTEPPALETAAWDPIHPGPAGPPARRAAGRVPGAGRTGHSAY